MTEILLCPCVFTANPSSHMDLESIKCILLTCFSCISLVNQYVFEVYFVISSCRWFEVSMLVVCDEMRDWKKYFPITIVHVTTSILITEKQNSFLLFKMKTNDVWNGDIEPNDVINNLRSHNNIKLLSKQYFYNNYIWINVTQNITFIDTPKHTQWQAFSLFDFFFEISP